jgi:branched-subunit amino acid aminotransferase/4-amino-4-deoxychorismate lyase
MAGTVFLNGKFIPQEEAKLAVSTPGLLYGWGLFETMRAYNNRIVYFDAHLERIKHSCKLIYITFPYSIDKLKNIIQRTVKINGFADAQVRLTLWKSEAGIDILVSVKKYQPYSSQKYKEGFRARVSSFRQSENSHLARLKTTNYLLYRLAYLEAEEKGFDEAIILNNRGYIAEGSRANIFLVKDRALWTPALECSCLDGITRKAVLDLARKYNIQAYEGNLTLYDLDKAEEAFLTNSLFGIMPLGSVERHGIGKSTGQYKLTRFFMGKYRSLLRNEL